MYLIDFYVMNLDNCFLKRLASLYYIISYTRLAYLNNV